MKARCYRKSTAPYARYGGRGITVCDEWRNSFTSFRDWALSNGYAEGLSLDRIDYNGNYEPSNCRWVTIKEQENNRCNNNRIEYNGEIRTISEWSEILGISQYALRHRIQRGWSIERALTTKERIYNKKG
jgi:hypothetical protein